MFHLELIAADLWGWVVPAAFIIIYIINHLLTAGRGGQQQPGQQRRRAAPQGERPLGQQPPREQGGQAQINAEIEQFLKRANQRRMEKAGREAPQQRKPASEPPKTIAPPLKEQPTDVRTLESRDFDSVATSVAQHLGNRS